MVTLKYCQDNLKKAEKGEKHKEEEEIKHELHRLRMKEEDAEGFEVDKEDFDNVLAKFQQKPTKAYDFLLKADDCYKDAIFKLCKRFIDTEDFPDKFRETLLYMLWKKKGSAEVLKK